MSRETGSRAHSSPWNVFQAEGAENQKACFPVRFSLLGLRWGTGPGIQGCSWWLVCCWSVTVDVTEGGLATICSWRYASERLKEVTRNREDSSELIFANEYLQILPPQSRTDRNIDATCCFPAWKNNLDLCLKTKWGSVLILWALFYVL